MRLGTFTIIIICVISCTGENKTPKIYKVIENVAFNEKAPHLEILSLSKRTDILWIDYWEDSLKGDWLDMDKNKVNLNEIFNEKEFNHLKNQYNRQIEMESSFLSEKINLVNPDDFKNQIDFQFYKISTPAFTEDGVYCLVYWEDVCHVDCGGGGFFVYERDEEGIWRRFLTKYLWMS